MKHRLGGRRGSFVGQLSRHQGAAVHFQQAVMDIPMYAAFRLQFKQFRRTDRPGDIPLTTRLAQRTSPSMRACSETIRTLSASSPAITLPCTSPSMRRPPVNTQVAFDARGNADQAVDFAFCITTEHGSPLTKWHLPRTAVHRSIYRAQHLLP
jgi:hypothetical protein